MIIGPFRRVLVLTAAAAVPLAVATTAATPAGAATPDWQVAATVSAPDAPIVSMTGLDASGAANAWAASSRPPTSPGAASSSSTGPETPSEAERARPPADGRALSGFPYFIAVFGTSGVSFGAGRRPILDPSQTSGSYLRPTTRSFIGMSALSVILMCSGQTSVQHLVMLQ